VQFARCVLLLKLCKEVKDAAANAGGQYDDKNMYAVDLKCKLVAHRVSSGRLLEYANTYIEGVKKPDKDLDSKWKKTEEGIRRLTGDLPLNIDDVEHRLREAWDNDVKAKGNMDHAKMKIKKVIIPIVVLMA
jgi:hypothetical protein